MKIFLRLALLISIILCFFGGSLADSTLQNLVLPGSCMTQPCVHGVCTEVQSGGHRCFCQNGYTGLSCQTNYDDCRSQPCLNGGSCIDGIDEFICICDQGFTGATCETDINECSSDPCLNGGTCEDLINDYLCHCPAAYFGINCEQYFNICASENEFCKNDGTCIMGLGNSTSCSCPTNFYGEKCEMSSCPCLRGGICLDDADFGCLCPFGFTGKTCETKLDICDSDICNGGLCILDSSSSENITNATVCFCIPDYHGKFCELQYNECIPESCQNGATCIDDVDGFSCICPAGFVGLSCNESYMCIGDHCQITFYETRVILTSYTFLHTASPYIPPETTTISPSADFIISQKMTESYLVPEHTYFSSLENYSSFLQVKHTETATSSDIPSLSFDQIEPTTTTAMFLSGTHFQEFHGHDESLNLSDFSSPIYPSAIQISHSISDEYEQKQTAMPFSSHKESEDFSSFHINKKGSENIEAFTTFPNLPSHPSPQVSCHGFHCQNGGTPSMSEGDGEICHCLCPLLYTGPNCERETYLLIPQFHHSSFLKHSLPPIDPQKGLDIDISFKTFSENGIIFFTEASNSGAFFMLHIEHGLLKLRFSCGQQTTVFMGTHSYVNNSFFTSISVSISWTPDIAHIANASCNVALHVNGSAPMSGQQFLLYPQFNFPHIYIGGLPVNFKTEIPEVDILPSFEGCVIFLQVNGEEKELVQDAELGVGITECYSSACYRSPCLNGATCKSYDDHWFCECLEGFAGPFCEHKTCFANPCEYGSTCLPDLDFGYLCLCPYGKHGKNCELDLSIRTPSFFGKVMGYSSYVQYELKSDHHYHLEIQLIFSVPDYKQKSLLLFNGQFDSSYLAHDFVAVSIHSGFIVSMFNLGSGTRVLKSANVMNQSLPVHTIVIGRHRRYCWIEVDSQPKVIGLTSGQLTALNTPSAVYVGGHSSFNFSLLPDEIKELNGFNGCVFEVNFRTSPGAIFHSIHPLVDGRNIQQCTLTECEIIRCANGGTCIDVGSTFQCNCAEGWVGPLCSQKSTPCSSGTHKCHSVSVCVPLEDGYRCNCPIGRNGKYCEKNVTISDPLFDGISSYLSTPMFNVRHSMDVILSVKPLSKEGLMFYAAQHLNELSRDFISLSLVSGYVQLRFNLGTDPSSTVILSSFKKVENNSWQVIEFGRYKRVAYLKLEDDEEVTSVSPPGMEILDIGTNFYLGGVPDLASLPKQAFEIVPSYFKGCIRLFSVNSRYIDMNNFDANIVSGQNIEDCDGTACGYNTCKNEGVCTPDEEGFSCECSKEFKGEECEVPTQCWKHSCLHGSTCVPYENTYKCLCPIGWQGDHCEIGMQVSSAFFSGNSYLMHRDVLSKHWNLTKSSISFKFFTNETFGLLLWTGKTYSEDSDYLGVGLVNNHLHVVWSLGWLSRNEIVTRKLRAKDRTWHSVRIERNQKVLALFVDDETYSSTVSGNFNELNTDGVYYFGGFPNEMDIEDETLGYFYSSFVGCMKELSVSGKSINIMDIKEGKNLVSCTIE